MRSTTRQGALGLVAACALVCACGSEKTPAERPTADKCPAITVIAGSTFTRTPTIHPGGDLIADETWTAAGSPHRLMDDLFIADGHLLTIEPCAVVELAEGVFIQVGASGSGGSLGDLKLVGVADQPIVVTGLEKKPGFWHSLRLSRVGLRTQLAYVTIEYGGKDGGFGGAAGGLGGFMGGMVWASGQNGGSSPTVVQTTLRKGTSHGFCYEYDAEFGQGSGALSVTGMTGFPIVIGTRGARSLPDGAYTGNGDDRVRLVAYGASVEGDITWRHLSVPYVLELHQQHAFTKGRLTIAAGVHINVYVDPALGHERDGLWVFDRKGALFADGIAESARIIIQGEGGQAWAGLAFSAYHGQGDAASLPGASTMAFVTVRNAGTQLRCQAAGRACTLDTDCATAVYLDGPYLTMNNTVIEGAFDGYGVVRDYCVNWPLNEVGDEFTKAARNNLFMAPMKCAVSEQWPCGILPQFCVSGMDCCTRNATCYGAAQ